MFVNIQTLRFWAAMAVVLYHLQPHLSGDAGKWLGWIRTTGYLGVDVFFVISGFIIAHTTRELEGGDACQRFFWRRLTRIFSGYWPYLLLALLLAWSLKPGGLDGKDLVRSLVLFPQPIPAMVLPVAWTLVFELYFYLAFTLLVWRGPVFRAGILWGLLGLLALVQVHALMVEQLWQREGFQEVSRLYRFYLSPYLMEFLCGALLATHLDKIRIAPWWPLVGMLLLGYAGLVYQSGVAEASLEAGYHAPMRVVWFGGAAVCLVWFLLLLEQKDVVLGRRYGLFLGAISYSLYLSHTLGLELTALSGLRRLVAGSEWELPAYLLVVAMIVLYSSAHYRWIEQPLMGFMRRMGARNR